MKITTNWEEPILDLRGRSIKLSNIDDIRVQNTIATPREIIYRACVLETDKNTEGKEKYARTKTALSLEKLIKKEGPECGWDVDIEDVTMLKNRIGIMFTAEIVTVMYDILDQKETKE
jgi:hypothetical protein